MDLTSGITKAEQEKITIQGRSFGEYVKNSEMIESKMTISLEDFKNDQQKSLNYVKKVRKK